VTPEASVPTAGPAALRALREARGLSVEDAARATRIPVAHVDAIEAGRFDDLPEGPYRAGLLRAYAAWLDVTPDPAVLDRLAAEAGEAPPPRTPLWAIRILAAGLCVVLLAAVVWTLRRDLLPVTSEAPAIAPNAPDQRVSVLARRTTHLRVLVDGAVVLDRAVPGGERVEVAGHRSVEVALEGADAARVEYNGELVVPQGRQDLPRRLVFIDDLDPGQP
jgi:transcriptional regulator with XRE-family HTH domain